MRKNRHVSRSVRVLLFVGAIFAIGAIGLLVLNRTRKSDHWQISYPSKRETEAKLQKNGISIEAFLSMASRYGCTCGRPLFIEDKWAFVPERAKKFTFGMEGLLLNLDDQQYYWLDCNELVLLPIIPGRMKELLWRNTFTCVEYGGERVVYLNHECAECEITELPVMRESTNLHSEQD